MRVECCVYYQIVDSSRQVVMGSWTGGVLWTLSHHGLSIGEYRISLKVTNVLSPANELINQRLVWLGNIGQKGDIWCWDH